VYLFDRLDVALSESEVEEPEEEYELEWDEPNDLLIKINLDNENRHIPYRGKFRDHPDGKIIASSYDPDACAPNLDWALVELTNPAYHTANPSFFSSIIPEFDSIGRLKTITESGEFTDMERCVSVCAGASGFVAATLNLRLSFFLSPGFTDLIRVFSMKIADKGMEFDISRSLVTLHNTELTYEGLSDLRPGDSGAWVIDRKTSQVYGHVIASGPFGEVYVVPMADTLQCIRKQLKADEVSIPTPGMVYGWIQQKQIDITRITTDHSTLLRVKSARDL
jgi:hypothetical protein